MDKICGLILGATPYTSQPGKSTFPDADVSERARYANELLSSHKNVNDIN